MRAIELKSVLTRISSAAGDDRLTLHLYLLEGIEGQVTHREAEHTLHHLLALRALHRHLTVVARLVVDDHVVAHALLHYPGIVLVDVRCVHHEQIPTLAHRIHQQVIHATSIGVTHDAIVYLAIGRIRNIVSKDMVNKLFGVGTTDEYLSHMRHVEYAARVSHRIVLLLDARVLYRHIKSAEGAHLRPEVHMLIMQTSVFQFFHGDDSLVHACKFNAIQMKKQYLF